MNDSNYRFGDRYQVIGRAGSGGMAEVYRARDELLGRDVAVKVLSRRLSTDRTFVERFRREAQAAANLNHPNVVSLFDYGSDGGTYYIVMEFIDGRPLSDIVRAEGPFMPERAAEIAGDVAAALDRAHAAGLVHRDIKPSNIMINSQGQTKVTDFGIARAMASDGEQTMTQTGMVIGTAAYLSPEQAQGNPVDPRSDVYSLGCVLFELLTARPPFAGDTPLSIAYKHVRENPAPPSSINPDVPAALDAVVMKALAKNPDNRYQSAAEFRDDLERFLTGQKVAATPLMATTEAAPRQGTAVLHETQQGYTPPPKKRRTGLIIFLVLFGLGVLALLGFLLANAFLGNKVDVPDLTGKTQAEALDILQNQGLKAEFENRASNKEIGKVVDQDPKPGDEIDEGGKVTVFLSGGPKQTGVPDLTGLTEDEAKKKLKDAKLELGQTTKAFSADFPEGQIIEQSPAADTEVDVGDTVDITVSKGPELVTVPDVTGQTRDQAASNLEALGFTVAVDEQPNADVDPDVVFDQDPAGGEEADPATTEVTIVVSTGPETFELPDVTGHNKDDARAQLEDLGLVVQESDQVCSETPNNVCDTNPDPGTDVAEGDTVTLLVQPAGPPTP